MWHLLFEVIGVLSTIFSLINNGIKIYEFIVNKIKKSLFVKINYMQYA